MITYDEERAFLGSIAAIADREYRRGFDKGAGVAEVAANWLRMTTVPRGRTKSRSVYTHEKIADMIDLRLAEERKRL